MFVMLSLSFLLAECTRGWSWKKNMERVTDIYLKKLYRGADKSLARPTFRCILFDAENISFEASLYIQGIHKRMVRFQKLTRNLFLTLHGHNVHRQQRQLSKFLMR